MEFVHKPVMLNECINYLNIKTSGIYVDCTIGGAGHSSEIYKRLEDNGYLIGIDQDPFAIKKAREKLESISSRARYDIVQSNFKYLKSILEKFDIDKVDGIIVDLGVSSFQLDDPKRGFSYRNDTVLDMRMDISTQETAYDIVNGYEEEDICRIIREYGEEKWAKRIAQFIVKNRKIKDIKTTFELVEIIKAAIPAKARKDGGHPAKRTFQALRIEVNKELDVIRQTMSDIIDLLVIGGRACIITFHSLEDRIVKEEIKEKLGLCSCPSNFPMCVCKRDKLVKKITKKPIVSGEYELSENSRAKSAKLRVVEKIKL